MEFLKNGLNTDHEIFTHLSRTIGLTNLLEMTSLAASSKTAENVASNCFVCIKSNAVSSKASSNLSSEEHWQRFRIKRRGVSPSPPYVGVLVKEWCDHSMMGKQEVRSEVCQVKQEGPPIGGAERNATTGSSL